MVEPKPLHSPIRVLWRGSEHHKRDLETIRPFWNWILQNKEYEVFLMGLQLHDVYAYFQGAVCVPWNPSPFAYWQQIKNLHADVAVFPLENTPFNESKSAIFAYEMFTIGVLPIVPSGFPEFEFPGVQLYHNHIDLQQHFKTDVTTFLGKEMGRRIEIIKAGQQWIRENRDLEKVNLKRKEIIESLWSNTQK
jgi:hypothetical protein